ncbi:MAG: hypothetical protein J3Q66DRAFT_324451 [Benniella sp.]|nr:MAG: hypothetical protein J3Q66DRAFT_324451 [Benniella sp.]
MLNTYEYYPLPLNLPPTLGDPTRYGHSAVSDGNGNVFVFGGFDNQGNIQSDMLLLDTKQPRTNWAFQALAKAPEGRAFHTATLLPDNTILIMWGQNGKAATTAQSTFMVFDIGRYVWTTGKAQGFPTMITTTESPNTPKPVPNDPPVVKPNPNGPNDPPQSNNPDKGISGSGSGGKANIPLIAGLCAAGVVLLFLIIVLILLIRRRNRRNRPIPTYHPTMMGKGDMAMAPPYEEEDKAKQATAFMIRRPPSVYMVDDQGADYDVNPNSKSQYYGERDTGRESSVADRDDRDYDDDDEPSSARRTNSSTGPRYPRAETSRRGQASTYEHPANDYFAA